MKLYFLAMLPLLTNPMALNNQDARTAPSRPQEVEFRFFPPDALTYTTVAESSIRKTQGAGETESDRGLIESKVTITRSQEGYVFKTEPQKMAIFHNELQIDNPLAKAIQGSVVSVEVNPSGEIMSLKGYEDLEERLKKDFKTTQVKNLMATINIDSLSQQAEQAWRRQVGGLIGRKVKVGDVWTRTESRFLGTDEVVYDKIITFKSLEKCGGKECVRLHFDYRISSEKKELQDVSSPVRKVGGQGEMLIDPGTMLIHSETSVQSFQLMSKTPYGPRLMNIMEKRSYQSLFP